MMRLSLKRGHARIYPNAFLLLSSFSLIVQAAQTPDSTHQAKPSYHVVRLKKEEEKQPSDAEKAVSNTEAATAQSEPSTQKTVKAVTQNSTKLPKKLPTAFLQKEENGQVIFHALPGGSLKKTVTTWGAFEKWQVIWESQYDYPILAPIQLRGEFVSVCAHLVNAYEDAERPLRADFYPAQNLVVITDA